MSAAEIALRFACEDDELIGVFHPGRPDARAGVLIVVGGPQYRVGSHRQFVLLARHLAGRGIPVLRFDYRGMGDASGGLFTFEAVNKDVERAIDELFIRVATLQSVVIWGLCDAASGALFYAHTDVRVSGLVLLNPWVRTEAGMAKAYLKHYYLQRLLSADFWKKVVSGKWNIRATLEGFLALARKLYSNNNAKTVKSNPAGVAQRPAANIASLPERMALGWESFKGPVLLILSGNNDYVADEFRDLVKISRRWRKILKRGNVTRQEFPQANHTFSRSDWRVQVAEWTSAWIAKNFPHEECTR